MERTIVVGAAAPVPRGNRVEVVQLRENGEIIGLHDLERGIRYALREVGRAEVDVWRGTVRECSVVKARSGDQTTLNVVTVDAAESAAEALLDADAAAAAAKAESDRWGGAARPQQDAPERFW